MNGAVAAEVLGRLVPLASGPHPEDDAVDDRAEAHPGSSRGLGGVSLVERRLDDAPEAIRQFPDRVGYRLFGFGSDFGRHG